MYNKTVLTGTYLTLQYLIVSSDCQKLCEMRLVLPFVTNWNNSNRNA